MRRRILAALAALGATAAPAAAGTVYQFYIGGTCSNDCANSGMADGDTVEGNFQVDTTNFTPGGQFLPSDMRFFIFNFGGSWIEAPGAGADYPAGGWYGGGTWGDTSEEITSFFFNAGPAPAGPRGVGLSISFNQQDEPDTIFTSLNALCDPGLCDTMSPLNGSFTDPPTITWEGEPGPAPVPLPPALALMLGGVAGLGALRLRRKAG